MALNAYNAAEHHIGLATAGGTNYGFQLRGGYDRELQREALGAQEFGGSTDLIGQTPGLSRVTQDDFVGGAYQYIYGKDDAMFADCTGFIPSPQARSLLTIPPFILKTAFDPAGEDDPPSTPILPKNMFMVGGSVYVVFAHGILRHQIDSDTNTWRGSESGGFLATDASQRIVDAHYDPELEDILVVTNDSTTDAQMLVSRLNLDLTDATIGTYAGPTTPNQTCRGFAIKDSNYVVQVKQNLWVGTPPANMDTVSSEITWVKVGRLPGRWIDSCIYNGMLYILLNENVSSPSFRSRLVAFDGSNILPILDMPFNIYARCLTEYAGRLYVGGTGTDYNGAEHYAELYEITGASTRLVRSFSPETRYSLTGDWPHVINDLLVFEGMLWWYQKGYKAITYDITSDGLFGAAEKPYGSNSTLEFYKFTSGRGRAWAWGTDSGDATKNGIYRIAQPNNNPLAAAPISTLITSDFTFEPGSKKRFSEFKCLTKYAALASLSYSIDAGENWTSLSLTTQQNNALWINSADLSAIAPIEHIRFKLTMSQTTTMTYSKELIAYTFTFAFLDSGKRAWNLIINGADSIETRDALLEEATTQATDMTDTADTIWGWARNKTKLTLTDIDGSTANVQMIGLKEHMPVIGPNIDSEGRPEAFYSVQLLEV